MENMHTDVGVWRVKACRACHKQCIFEVKIATFGGTPKPLIPKRSASHFSLQYQLKITGKGQENQESDLQIIYLSIFIDWFFHTLSQLMQQYENICKPVWWIFMLTRVRKYI